MRRMIVIACLVAAACGGDDKGSTTATVKMGEICDAFSEITCAWFAQCDFEVPSCEQTYRDACCTGTACNQDVEGVLGDWRDCYEAALDATSCTGEGGPGDWTECQD